MRLMRGSTEQVAEREEGPIAAIGGVVYRWKQRGQLELLLIKKEGGFWTLPKGRIKPGEDERAAVMREVVEETGIGGEVESVVKQVSYHVQKSGGPRLKVVTYYLVRAVRGSPRPDPKERIERVRWFPIDTALQRIRRGRIQAVVETARGMLGASDVADKVTR